MQTYRLLVPLALHVFRQAPRSYRRDAAAAVGRLRPPLEVTGRENVPAAGPCVLTVNHFVGPGFFSPWITLALSAVVPAEILWIVAAEWRCPGQRRAFVMRPFSRWFIGRIARTYGFVRMPAMPPAPGEEQARAESVRRVLAHVHRYPASVIGLAPEGGDQPGGRLAWPPPGVGRFVLHLAAAGLAVVPVGLHLAGPLLRVRFGEAYTPAVAEGLPAAERDRLARRLLMEHIAQELPPALGGEFAPPRP